MEGYKIVIESNTAPYYKAIKAKDYEAGYRMFEKVIAYYEKHKLSADIGIYSLGFGCFLLETTTVNPTSVIKIN